MRGYVKAVKQDIVYLGFPETILPEILSDVKTRHAVSCIIRKTEQFIEIQGFPDTVGFEQWKAEIDITTGNEKSSGSQQDEIIRKIKEYPIISKTPVEAFSFLAELQRS